MDTTTHPRPVPAADRPLRIVMCRSCGQPTGIPGAAFCHACRPQRLPSSDILMTDTDWQLEACEAPMSAEHGVAWFAGDNLHPAGWLLTTNGTGNVTQTFATLPEAVAAHQAR